MACVLIIDDDTRMCRVLEKLICRMGHTAISTNTIHDGLAEIHGNQIDVVFLDVNLPDGNGIDVISEIRESNSAPEVIIITGFGDGQGAEMALRYGAWDYIQKTVSPEEITLPLKRILQYREGLKKNRANPVALKMNEIVGKSTSIKNCYDLVAQAASNTANVLITGDTGTGKELFSKAIHENSARRDNRFVVVDCAALPETLVESVLFGHVKGAFTGADAIQEGLVKQADYGTLFLDEIGELSLSIQKAFLRALQEKCFRPVGSKNEIHSDFRLISATNRNLDEMAKAGSFREDLLFRLKTLHIPLPSLGSRTEDIIDIALFHTKKFCSQSRVGIKGFSPEFEVCLLHYDWPGNVRELINSIQSALSASLNDPVLLPIHLPLHIRIKSTQAKLNPPNGDSANHGLDIISQPQPTSFRETMKIAEKNYLKQVLSTTNGNITKCCDISNLSRSRLYGLMKEHQITSR
ncbi:MAG: sigma-54-dependent Fis family transcriptional regulator [Desulfobacteraceae bacterium]|nr:sigma-54-dependent Fis family transcriptional regulator [Desulfobacteraceae bacterium]MBU4053955.1 sigma-54 dependent transcriptional regulator [Pseudomonadota bacterium]